MNSEELEKKSNPEEIDEQISSEELIDSENDELVEETDYYNPEESAAMQPKQRFGEAEYNAAKNEHGVYDKNYYAKRGTELDNKVASAEEEKKKNKKEVIKKDENGNKVQQQKNKNVFDKAKDNVNVLKAKNDRFQNKLANAKSKAYQVMHPGQALKDKAKSAVKNVGKKAGQSVAKGVKKVVKSGTKRIIQFAISNPYMFIISIVVIFLFMVIFFMLFEITGSAHKSKGIYGYDYTEPGCTEITINGGTYAGVYDIEEYIAGVTYAEFGLFLNEDKIEAAKAGAIAARSFVLANVGDSCTVESSQRFQVYKTPTEEAKQIAYETRGLVLAKSGSIISTQYDAFCTDSPQNDPDNYIVCQQNQKVPRSWVDSQAGISSEWKNGTRTGAHGNGMSQWGSAYLAEQGYDYKKILEYYYGDFEIMSIYKSLNYSSEYAINPNDASYSNLAFLINNSLEDFLISKGTSVENFNSYLYDQIEEAGIGTREGVVSAAVSLIGSLAEMGVKLNYQWGGKYYSLGVNSNWGSLGSTSCDSYASAGYNKSVCLTNYKWVGFDCSGFVNWTLKNGMQDTTVPIQSTTTSGGISLSSSKAVCKPGGVLVSSGHIVLVVDIDDANKRYIVAESTGSRISSGYGGVKLSYYSYNASGYVCKNLDEIYGE